MSDAQMPPPGDGTPGGPGQPPPPPNWGAPPPPQGYGQPQYGAPAGGYSGGAPLAEWPQRAVGGLIDFVAPIVVVGIFVRINVGLGLLLDLVALAWFLYNGYLNGTTGKSIGHQVAGVKVIRSADGQLMNSGGLGIVRWLAHIVDSIICYVGWLFPLWDSKKQTLADKIMSTVVVVDKT